jgi:hypothetical protein
MSHTLARHGCENQNLVFARAFGLSLLVLFAAGCSSNSTPAPSALTASTFVMTWATTTFPSTSVGTSASTPVVITLSNYGTAPVPVASVSDDNRTEFPWTTTCSVGGSLAANSTCAVTAQFTPNALGAQTTTLTINANGANQTFALSGAGIAAVNPHVTISPASGSVSTIFTLSVTGMTPGGSLTLNTAYTPAPGNPSVPFAPTTWTADANGNVTISLTSNAPGTYDNWLVDVASGLSTNHVTHTVQ